jgi:hypothetical protein
MRDKVARSSIYTGNFNAKILLETPMLRYYKILLETPMLRYYKILLETPILKYYWKLQC